MERSHEAVACPVMSQSPDSIWRRLRDGGRETKACESGGVRVRPAPRRCRAREWALDSKFACLCALATMNFALVLLDAVQANNQFATSATTPTLATSHHSNTAEALPVPGAGGGGVSRVTPAAELQSTTGPLSTSPPRTPALQAFEQYLAQLRSQDRCRSIYTAKTHGYDVRDYLVVTYDKYELHLHRLIHPEDYQSSGAQPVRRKPFLLVHGLIGTSASWLTNVEDFYRAPPQTYRAEQQIGAILESRSRDYQYEWQSTAEYMRVSSAHEQAAKFLDRKRMYADSLELQFDGPHMEFGRQYRQAYKKFQMPKDSLGFVSNSLAMTLANFGYDVWLVNLRGNEYSRKYNGPLSADRAEYWDFNIETVFREDLAATIRFIQRETRRADHEPIGLATYSYSAAYALGLLTKFPKYQQSLRPLVMIAPTLLTGTSERGKFKYFMKVANSLISKNGPFPVWGRAKSAAARSAPLLSLHHIDHKLERLACSLPVASKLCRLLETIIHGKTKQVASVKGLLSPADRASALMQRDTDCGQTSKAILHQIIENLSQPSIQPHFMPFVPAKQSHMPASGRAPPARPAVMLVHSDEDAISTPSEVARIRDSALKTLTLVDYIVREPKFDHTAFLFSHRNQYLVNAEVMRMVLVHDWLTDIWDRPPPPRPRRLQPAPPAPPAHSRHPSASGSSASASASTTSGAGAASGSSSAS